MERLQGAFGGGILCRMSVSRKGAALVLRRDDGLGVEETLVVLLTDRRGAICGKVRLE